MAQHLPEVLTAYNH